MIGGGNLLVQDVATLGWFILLMGGPLDPHWVEHIPVNGEAAANLTTNPILRRMTKENVDSKCGWEHLGVPGGKYTALYCCTQ